MIMDLMTRSANAVVHSRLKALSEETGEQPYDLALSELRYYATALQTTREALADSLAAPVTPWQADPGRVRVQVSL